MIADVDPIIDLDGGGAMGWLLYGTPEAPVDDLDLEVFLGTDDVTDAFPHGTDLGFEATWTYVRKVPTQDEYGYPMTRYVYADSPGPGARRCLRVEKVEFWGHWCHNHIWEPATVGIGLDQVVLESVIWPFVHVRISAPSKNEWADRRWPGPRDGDATIYLCGECRCAYNARLRAAREEQRERLGAA